MFSLILGALTGLAGPISTITSNLTDLKRAKINAETDVQKAEINASVSELEARRAVLIAEAGSRLGTGINASVRLLLALGPALFLSKIFIWDKVVGSLVGCANTASTVVGCSTFNTDKLDPNLWWVTSAVVCFYFLHSALKGR